MEENTNLEVLESQQDVSSTSPVAEFLEEDDIKSLNMLQMQSRINEIRAMSDKISNNSKELLDDENLEAHLDEQTKDLTPEEIRKLSDERIEEIYTCDGQVIQLDLDFKGNTGREIEFKRDFLAFRREIDNANKRYDEEIAKIEAEIADKQQELDEAVAHFGNISNFVRTKLVESIAKAKDDIAAKERFELYLKMFDNALSLDIVKEYVSSYRGAKILGDFKNDKHAQSVYKKYLKVVEEMHIRQDLTRFNNIENYLPEEYQIRRNIFVYTVIHMIASWYGKNVPHAYGLFMTQFVVNLKNLVYDKFESPEEKEKFITAIKEVIDIRK